MPSKAEIREMPTGVDRLSERLGVTALQPAGAEQEKGIFRTRASRIGQPECDMESKRENINKSAAQTTGESTKRGYTARNTKAFCSGV